MSDRIMQQPTIAVVMGMEGYEDVAVTVPHAKLDDLLFMFERNLAITVDQRNDPARHLEERGKLLALMLTGLKGSIPDQPWSTTCAMGFIWSAVAHPETGQATRDRIAALIDRQGHATLVLAPGPDSSLAIEVAGPAMLEPATAGYRS